MSTAPLPTARSSKLLLVALGLLSLLTIVGTVVGATSRLRGISGVEESRCRTLPEPPAAAAFIEAERDRDVERASLVTSPLYRAELERRGRGSDWPLAGLWVEAAPRLDYAYLGAVSDDDGFTYTLYKARPKHPDGPNGPTSLWRIDLDPQGQVIWGEFARLFAQPRIEVFCDLELASVTSYPLPSLARLGLGSGLSLTLSGRLGQPRIALGARSTAGDGYVALHPDSEQPKRLAFSQLSASGELSPSYWSFGEPIPTRDAELHPVDPRPFDLSGLTDADAEVLRAYDLGLEWSPADQSSVQGSAR